jgi:hypothetical protein
MMMGTTSASGSSGSTFYRSLTQQNLENAGVPSTIAGLGNGASSSSGLASTTSTTPSVSLGTGMATNTSVFSNATASTMATTSQPNSISFASTGLGTESFDSVNYQKWINQELTSVNRPFEVDLNDFRPGRVPDAGYLNSLNFYLKGTAPTSTGSTTVSSSVASSMPAGTQPVTTSTSGRLLPVFSSEMGSSQSGTIIGYVYQQPSVAQATATQPTTTQPTIAPTVATPPTASSASMYSGLTQLFKQMKDLLTSIATLVSQSPMSAEGTNPEAPALLTELASLETSLQAIKSQLTSSNTTNKTEEKQSTTTLVAPGTETPSMVSGSLVASEAKPVVSTEASATVVKVNESEQKPALVVEPTSLASETKTLVTKEPSVVSQPTVKADVTDEKPAIEDTIVKPTLVDIAGITTAGQ